MAAAANEDCKIENCCLMRGRSETFDSKRFKSIKGNFSDGANE